MGFIGVPRVAKGYAEHCWVGIHMFHQAISLRIHSIHWAIDRAIHGPASSVSKTPQYVLGILVNPLNSVSSSSLVSSVIL